MSSVRRRRLTAASLAAFAALTLSACGTGFDAQTNQVYQPAVGANERGDVESHNTQLVANTDGSATLSASLQNNLPEAQTLASITVTDDQGDTLSVRSPKGSLDLASDVLTKLGSTTDGIFVVTEGAKPGSYVNVTYTFGDSGPLTIKVPVVERTEHADEYEDVAGGDGLVPAAVSGAATETE